MGKVRKNPLRTCVGCNEVKDKRQLIRVVKTPDNSYLVDRTGKKSGRGAYICPNKECLEKAIVSKGFDRSFKEKLSPDILDDLKKQFFGE